MFERLAGNAIQIDFHAAADAGSVAMTESAFERILLNLVGNAIDAMPGGGRLRIALARGQRSRARRSRQPAPRTLLLRVSDTGVGIAADRLPYIFDPGTSTKTEDDSSLHGFGLAIVRELTERAAGTVRVASAPGAGSCFEIELPRL